MEDEVETPAPEVHGSPDALAAGTYEVLRDRLRTAAEELARRAEALNAGRVAEFGGTEARLAGTAYIRTGHDCVPRDIVQIGGMLLFGANVPLGRESGTDVGDVFSLQHVEFTGDDGEGGGGGEGAAIQFRAAAQDSVPGLLDDPAFRRDFAELYRFYRETRLLQLRLSRSHLLAVFQTGNALTDIRVLRWRVAPDGSVAYVDDRGERDHVFPPAHDVEWTAATRADHVQGRHPHVSVRGLVFVACVGGALTLKAEDSTDSGDGVYSEPVDEPLQSLADAEIEYAVVGPLVLLRILPYNEKTRRHLVYNTRTTEVVRLDGLGRACRRLPEEQGVIFPGGYYLADVPAGSAARTFDIGTNDLEYEGVVRSPNGEDVLYVFHARAEGRSLLLPYNVIRKEVATVWQTRGWSLFDDGTVIVFGAAAGSEPTRVHPMQVWRTPYVADAHAAARPAGTGPLARIGNAELVRAVSDCLTVARMADGMEPNGAVFEAIVAAATRVADRHHWLGEAACGDLAAPLESVRTTAAQVIDEFERVEELRAQAAAAVDEAADRITGQVRRARGTAPDTVDGWVRRIAGLRRSQGRLETLREQRYADLARIGELDTLLGESLAAFGRRAVAFLAEETAFDAAHRAVDELAAEAAAVETAAAAGPLAERIDEQAGALQAVTEVVGTLDLADATVRTSILARIGEVLGAVNRARARLDGRRRELHEREGRAEFAAEFALLGQAVTGGLAAAGTPDECDEQVGRLMLRLENLEAKFASGEDFAEQIVAKREEVYEAFSARKQAQLDERARHADRLARSAGRILDTVSRRAAALASADDINTFFASDPLVAKVRTTAAELRTLGDTVHAEELEGRLKAARQEAARALRDRTDLYDGQGTLRLGRHRFAVSFRPAELTLVPQDGQPVFVITGTDYRAPVADPRFADTRGFWDQPLVSESPAVYRGEYLAARLLAGTPAAELAAAAAGGGLVELAREAVEAAYDEGYDRGVHDRDAAAILGALLGLQEACGLLRFTPEVRAAGQLFWAYGTGEEERAGWSTRARSLARARATFGLDGAAAEPAAELAARATEFLAAAGLPCPGTPAPAGVGAYLFEELAAADPPAFVTSPAARTLRTGFRDALGQGPAEQYERDLDALAGDPVARHQLAAAWLGAYAAGTGADASRLAEAVAMEVTGDGLARQDSDAATEMPVDGLLGAHRRIDGGRLVVRLDEFLTRTTEFREVRVPAYRAYLHRRTALVAAERERLRLDTYRPRVMPAFVRNRLLDEVYLPLIGDNLARQLGAAGGESAARRTDSQGLLLLLSPPGYGKTSLMEYIAARLGLVFVKVDGPALGSGTTSLDPAAAPDAAARREVEKINLALAMGNNTLLYLDDIQHTSPELLQRFVSLCDAQRRMEGVWDGSSRVFDLRGKRFAVCMAGNPFTESGARFQIPDMLANRADVWNLGDVLSGKEQLFALSHIENALTSNPVLAPLTSRERTDIDLLLRLAQGDPNARPDRLAHPYATAELDQILGVLRRLLHVRQTVLKVNAAYIASAAQADASRTEPPFKLQGSYRNTNKLAERIVPVMNDDEVEALIDDHYLGEAQTLAQGAEANLLKLAELRGRLTPHQTERWKAVKASYAPPPRS
ncbi:DNA repair ATPase [Streptomyces sp. CMB-StM0423]|uniref:DNA repair ATPase n=1 Tax=Streptomyces sp. CMB-StM0423 TaxID=2059884 RepID=UPI000C700462|nr:DNA repair ATPase [Streptomyces sp. CMB-StM0423]AUH44588.1 DNA repair ATPase [Streptomyces sp. CMB-StM0423]